MITRHSPQRLLALAALACAFALPLRANAALFVDAPASGLPGGTFDLKIGLDAPLVAVIDDLMLEVDFDPAVLTGLNAVAGALLGPSTGSFLANAPDGIATHSFTATLTELGAGLLATWTFRIAPAAVPGTSTVVSATLRTFEFDSVPTATLSSNALTIAIVPEPSIAWLLLAGLAGVGALRALRRR